MNGYRPVYDTGCFRNAPISELENHMIMVGCNEDERPIVHECNDCEEPIRENDTYLEVPQSDGTRKYYCEPCINFMTHIAEYTPPDIEDD